MHPPAKISGGASDFSLSFSHSLSLLFILFRFFLYFFLSLSSLCVGSFLCVFVWLYFFQERYKTFAHFSRCDFVLITRVFFGKLTIYSLSPIIPKTFASFISTCHLFFYINLYLLLLQLSVNICILSCPAFYSFFRSVRFGSL